MRANRRVVELAGAALSFALGLVAWGAGMTLTRDRRGIYEFQLVCLALIAVIGFASALVIRRFPWLGMVVGSLGFGMFMLFLAGMVWNGRMIVEFLELVAGVATPFALGAGVAGLLSSSRARSPSSH